ncbi:MAG: hypothetical protein JRJ69_02480 [Deltaproteobacteria bacterium]|nr:hypothetical protein [Deltaproteobacteria bacterium]MBW1736434.1 hypothetical protein [Deltaproteobacteria bacterium]MBW1907933.1 hypothetical protein [Deltaproteobacteria bacterium]MBW2033206.1 hypothetical protein [Deltaproteobacteria bacterium]MBW2113729.1 hypothetical protein [Deltaproteobacteria bacterium]
MENQKRDVVPPVRKDRAVKRKHSRSSDLTIMIVARLGKVRSFKISSRFLIWTSLFFAFYILASVIIINDYFDKRRANNALIEKLDGLQHEIEGAKRELYSAKQHLALLESHIYPQEVDLEKEGDPAEGKMGSEKMAALAAEDGLVERVAEESQETLVNIKDLTIKFDGTKLSVIFNLVNVHEDEKPVKGYVHMIAMNKESDPPQLWTYPKVALRNGIPIDYRRGQLFLIKRFKTIRGEYFFSSSKEFPSSMKVLVYDQSGKVILQKEFEVENAL